MDVRIESDSMGDVEVAADRYYGAQTQRSLGNFAIGQERFSREMIKALGIVKKASALVNHELGTLEKEVTREPQRGFPSSRLAQLRRLRDNQRLLRAVL